MNASNQSPHNVLMVTTKASSRRLSWADLAGSAAEALERWHRSRHPFVFADFGDLGDGMTGGRLASVLRKECIDVVVILLVDKVLPHHLSWAQRNGATDVIERTANAIASCLPAGWKASQITGITSDSGPRAAASVALASPTPLARVSQEASAEKVAAVVDEHLQKHGRLGPARALVLRDALDALLDEKGSPPTVSELANRVAVEIVRPEHRLEFLNSFHARRA